MRKPGAAGTENQGSTLGDRNFEYDFINKSISNFQYDRDYTITNDYNWLLMDLILSHVGKNIEIPRKRICIIPCSIYLYIHQFQTYDDINVFRF